MKRLRRFLLVSSLLGGFCQLTLALPPDFSTSYRFTNRPGEPTDGVTVYSGATSTLPINNSTIGCVGFSFTYNSEGFSGVSINLQTSPKFQGGQASGTWSTYGGTATTGTLPMTGTSQGTYIGYGYYPFIRINLATATGTGSIDVQFQCWKSISYASTLGGGGTGGVVDATAIANAQLLTISGGTVTYTATTSVVPSALVSGQVYYGVMNVTNSTTAPTLNINGKGAVTITHNAGTALLVSELDASGLRPCWFQYNGTSLLLFNGSCSTGGTVIDNTPISAANVPNAVSAHLNDFQDLSNSNYPSQKDASGNVLTNGVLPFTVAGAGYWSLGFNSQGTVAIASTTVIRCIHIPPDSMLVRRIGVRVSVATAAKGTIFALYDINDNLLSSGRSIGLGAGGIPFTLGSTVAVAKGIVYNLCWMTEDASFSYYTFSSNGTGFGDLMFIGTDVQMFTVPNTTTGTNTTYAAPATLGVHTLAEFSVPLFVLLP